jgi:hypothetical protein
MVAGPLARLEMGRRFLRRLGPLGRANADVHETRAVLKGGLHRPKYACEVLPIKN